MKKKLAAALTLLTVVLLSITFPEKAFVAFDWVFIKPLFFYIFGGLILGVFFSLRFLFLKSEQRPQQTNPPKKPPQRKRKYYIAIAMVVCVIAGILTYGSLSLQKDFNNQGSETGSKEAKKALDDSKKTDGKMQDGDQNGKGDEESYTKTAWVASAFLLILVAYITYLSFSNSGNDMGKFIATPLGVAYLVILVLQLVLAIAFPKFWYAWVVGYFKLFLLINVCVLACAYLWSNKNPAAKWVSIVCTLVIGLRLIITFVGGFEFGKKLDEVNPPASSTPTKTRKVLLPDKGKRGEVFGTIMGVPIPVVAVEIARCESNGMQFEPGTTIPFRNKGIPSRGIPPSDAAGKYQYKKLHWNKAEAMGFPLYTEMGQDGYTIYLLSTVGTEPWEHDEEYGGGRACWGERLEELAKQDVYELTLQAPKDEWSYWFPIPKGFKIRVDQTEEGVWESQWQNQNGESLTIKSSKEEQEKMKGVQTFVRVKSLEQSDLKLTIKLTRIGSGAQK